MTSQTDFKGLRDAATLAHALREDVDLLARLQAAETRAQQLEAALRDAAGHLMAAASAYRTYARRYSGLVPKAQTDALFTTRAADFDKAAERARKAVTSRQAIQQGEDNG